MAGLKVEANLENTIENIVALREEIDRLKKSLIEVAGVPNSDKAVKKLEAQLQKAMKSLREYQSKYSQLKKAYDDVIGSEETIKKVHEETKGLQSTNQWIVANTKAVKEADAEIKKLKNNFKGLTDEEKTGEKGYGILRQVEYQVAVRKKEEEAIRRTIKAQKEQIIQSESEEGSITSLRKQLNQLIITYDNIGRANRNGGVGKDLLTQIKAVQTELNAAEQATGRFQRNVGNYSSAFNGLGMSIQQIARELPSATMGINMFFLAISNNLPIFFDEVQKARKEYAAYLAELSKGNKDIQKVAPVWKQLAAGIFSWNTALVVGITLLTAYGKEIFDYIGGIFKAKEAIDYLSESQKVFNESMDEGAKNAQKDITRLQLLYKAAIDTARGMEERNKAVAALQKEYPDYFKNLDAEAIKNGTAQQSYENLAVAILKAAQARAVENRIAKNSEQILDYENAITEAYKKQEEAQKKLDELMVKQPEGNYGSITINYDALREEIAGFGDEAAEARQKLYLLQKQNNDFANSISAIDLTFNAGDDSDKGNISGVKDINAYTDQLHRIAELERKQTIERQRQQQDLDNQLEQSRIDSLQDGYEKEQAQRELNNKKEIQALERQKEDYIRAYIQGQKEIFDAQEELKAKQTKGYVKKSFSSSSISVDTSIFDSIIGNTRKRQYSDEIREQEASWNEYLVKFGNYQQKRKAIIDKYDQAIKEASNAGDEGMLEEEKRQQLNNLDEQYGKTTRAMADLFEDASNKSVSAIQSIIDKYETLVKYMSGTKESDGTNVTLDELKALGFTDKDIEKIEKGEISIKDVTDAIRGLKDELKGKSPWQAFVSDLEKGIESIKKGGNDSKKIGQGITDIGNAVTSFAPALNEFGTDIAYIFGIDDSKITGAIEALGGLGQTAAGVGQIMSGDIVGGAMSAVSGISTVVSALDGMFGADYSRYNKMVEEYNKLNEIWDELIDKKREYIDMSYGVEADKVGQEAIDLVEKQIEAYRTLGKERLNSGASVGSHSIGKRMAKNTSSSDWQDIANALDMSVNAAKEFIGTGRMTGLFDLTVEQLEKLKSDAPTFWADMDDDVREYLDSIIEGEAKIEEIQNQVKERLTQTTFDSVFDSFVDTLMDMDSSAKDFAEDFSEYMQRAILTNMVGEKFSKELQDWYDSFAEAGKDKEGITKEDMEELRKQYEEIVDAAVAERDKLAEIFGWTGEATHQSASSKGFQSMSQDTGEELNGRFTALQIAGEEIKNQNIAQSQSLSILNTRIDTISSTSSNIRDIASETRDIIASSYLELVQISENTGAIVKPVQQMQKDIAEVKKNTSKL